MNKIPLEVPSDVKYISEWKGYTIPEGKCIVDKKVCGCGYTQFCITNKTDDVILCSPRKSLLENKEEQNSNCLYFKPIVLSKREKRRLNIKSEDEEIDFIYKLQCETLKNYIDSCNNHFLRLKILVTYDSLPKLLSILIKLIPEKRFNKLKVVVDEFQLVFNDAKFKAGVELDFVEYLEKYCNNVVYLSGTPMLEEYLDCIPEFKNLPYYELIWDDSRVSKIEITRIKSSNLEKTAIELIKLYQDGFGPEKIVNGVKYKSKEAVLFVNNISMITAIIKGSGIKAEDINIITAKTPDNLRKIKKCGKEFGFGRIPLLGEKHKLITICTSTAFCGVDMYSETAKSYVFSSCNLKTMTIDISLELPQIVGRQRLESNPFRRDITIFYSDSIKNYSIRDFREEIARKTKTTFDAIEGFNILRSSEKANIDFERKKLKLWISKMNYTEDYTSISRDTGLPVFNTLMRISDIRSWELQNRIYNNEPEVIRVLNVVGDLIESDDNDLFKMLERSISEPSFEGRLSVIKEFLDIDQNKDIVYALPEEYAKYISSIEGCVRKSVLDKKIARNNNTTELLSREDVVGSILERFIVGEVYTKKEIKIFLSEFSKETNVNLKATDIARFFEVSEVKITNKETGKRDSGYRILSIKN